MQLQLHHVRKAIHHTTDDLDYAPADFEPREQHR